MEALVSRLQRQRHERPNDPLGPDYQLLVNEYQPLFTWATACWDYLLTTEGCRFIPRHADHRIGLRGDYRVITDRDYGRLVHRIFRHCVFEFAQQPHLPSLTEWLRQSFWPGVLTSYRALENPPDRRQRPLTAYSYLRCVPYRFLNTIHETLVRQTIGDLPARQAAAIRVYFLNFFTEHASAEALGCSVDESLLILRAGLSSALSSNRLVYCLLRQIERY